MKKFENYICVFIILILSPFFIWFIPVKNRKGIYDRKAIKYFINVNKAPWYIVLYMIYKLTFKNKKHHS